MFNEKPRGVPIKYIENPRNNSFSACIPKLNKEIRYRICPLMPMFIRTPCTNL